MNPILRNILSFLAGLVGGSVVNMALINVSSSIIPPPEGADVTTYEGLKASMYLFGPEHFIFPFLAHALGTLAGAFLASKLVVSHKAAFGIGVSVFFLIGGIANAVMLPAPNWFITLDLVVAYLPMGWLGARLAAGRAGN